MSKDGVERRTFRVSVRLTREQVATLEQYAKSDCCPKGWTLRQVLEYCLRDGIERVEDEVTEEARINKWLNWPGEETDDREKH